MATGEDEDERDELGIKMAESEPSTDRSEQVKYCLHKNADPPTYTTQGFNRLNKEQRSQTLEQMFREKYEERYDIFQMQKRDHEK